MAFINNKPTTSERALTPEEGIAARKSELRRALPAMTAAANTEFPDFFVSDVQPVPPEPEVAPSDIRPDTAGQMISLAAMQDDQVEVARQRMLEQARLATRRSYDEAA